MILRTIVTCNICGEEFSGEEPDENLEIGGVGLVFLSWKSGDFTIDGLETESGVHICNPCALTLLRELTKYFK